MMTDLNLPIDIENIILEYLQAHPCTLSIKNFKHAIYYPAPKLFGLTKFTDYSIMRISRYPRSTVENNTFKREGFFSAEDKCKISRSEYFVFDFGRRLRGPIEPIGWM